MQHNLAVEAQVTDDEREAVQNLRDKVLEEIMVKRGVKAMQRSLRKKKDATMIRTSG